MAKRITKKWLKILGRIPGYDPVATAGECWFDPEAAQRVLDFFPQYLRHSKGEKAGEPFILEPVQSSIVANLFGWQRPDGTRRYRNLFMYVPRKNGKTMLGAGIVLYMLMCDGEPGADVYSAAADRDQASIIFNYGSEMVRQEPALNDRCTIYGGGPAGQSKTIALKKANGLWKCLSADAHTKHGLNVHCAAVDELHAHPNRDLYEVLETGTGSRSQPLMLVFTTADWDRPSICNEQLEYAKRVRDGKTDDPALLPAIWEADPKKDDWTDEKVWRRVNPLLDVSIRMDYLREQCRKAQETPARENGFKRLHLNWKTEQAIVWLPMDKWHACAGVVDPAELEGQPCYAGLDLATTKDLTAFVLYFPETHAVLPFFWVPGDNARLRERRDHVEYETWGRQGYINLTPGTIVEYPLVRARIRELAELYDIQEIAYDPWNARETALALQDKDGFEMVEFRQGWKTMNEPMKRLEALVLSGELAHGHHPVLDWNAGNVCVKVDESENIRPDKKRSTEKIDGIVALAMAIGLSISGGGGDKESVYTGRGLVTV
jgi:phage terminase large subunit-like protein